MKFAKQWPILAEHAAVRMDIMRKSLAEETARGKFSLEMAAEYTKGARNKTELLEKKIFPLLEDQSDIESFARIIKQCAENIVVLEKLIKTGKKDILSLWKAQNAIANLDGWMFGLELIFYMSDELAKEEG